MSLLRKIYLVLAIVGAIVPMWFKWPWFADHGYAVSALVAAWKSNGATTGIYWDMIIAAATLTIFIVSETYVRKNWIALICIPATWLIGVSCGLPLYMFLRYRPVT